MTESKTTWPIRRIEAIFLPEFTFQENLIKLNYNILQSIARGAFGTVHKVKNLQEDKEYALKILSKAKVEYNYLIIYLCLWVLSIRTKFDTV